MFIRKKNARHLKKISQAEHEHTWFIHTHTHRNHVQNMNTGMTQALRCMLLRQTGIKRCIIWPETQTHTQSILSIFSLSLYHTHTQTRVHVSVRQIQRCDILYLQCTDSLVIKHLNEQITSFPIWKFHYDFHNWIPNLISAPGLNSMWFEGECRCCQRSWTLV